MRVALTGGTGFIGVHLIPLLQGQGHEILVLSRQGAPSVVGKGVRFVACDLNNLSEGAKSALKEFQPEAAIHLAWQGIPDYSMENCHRNFVASVEFFQLLLKAGCRKIVGAGSCWEYGELRGVVRESDEAKELSVFAAYKTSARLVLESLCKPLGASAVWPRIFFVYGPGQRSEALIPSTVRKLRGGEKIDLRSPNAQNDFIYVGDVAKGYLSLLEAPQASGVYNLGFGRPTRVGDVVRDIQASLSMPQDYAFSVEDRPGESFWAEISRMEKEIGWKPQIDLKTGLGLVTRVI